MFVLAFSAHANAQFIEPGTEYTLRVIQTPSAVRHIISGDAHSFTANVVSGTKGAQQIGTVFDSTTGGDVIVEATETYSQDAQGNFVFTLSVTSAGDLSQGPLIVPSGTGMFIGQNLIGGFSVDPDWGGATPQVPFLPSNAMVLTHVIESATLEVFDLSDGTLRGSGDVTSVAAFNDPDNDFFEWEGFLGVTVNETAEGIPAGTIPATGIGEVRLTLVGSVEVDGDTTILGDVNRDGVVDLLDVAPFVDLILNGGFSEAADLNNDGVVDLLDVAPFVALLLG